MFQYIWPIGLVIFSNILYQICAKSVPETMDPFASLTVTYAVGAVVSAAFYYIMNRQGSILREYSHINWAPFVLGLVVVGLEVGFLFAYKVGWPVSTASTVQSSFLAVALLVVGYLIYGEPLTARKAMGIAICLVGLYFLNK